MGGLMGKVYIAVPKILEDPTLLRDAIRSELHRSHRAFYRGHVKAALKHLNLALFFHAHGVEHYTWPAGQYLPRDWDTFRADLLALLGH
jgi:hypothetical protein